MDREKKNTTQVLMKYLSQPQFDKCCYSTAKKKVSVRRILLIFMQRTV